MHMPRPFHLAMLCAPFLSGCNPALWGNLLVLAVSVGIFWGTLSLGRAQEAARSRSGASQSFPSRRS